MKISKLVRLFIILFAAFFSVTVVLTLAARQMNSNVVEVLRSQAELKSFGLQLQETFDFLVQQAQNYAIYGEEKSIEAYRNEVGTLKNREKAIEGLKTSGAAQDELALTLKAMELSNELVRLDSLAFDKYDMENMDVVLKAQGIIFGTEYEENRRLIAETMERFQSTMNARTEAEASRAEGLADIFQLIALAGTLLSMLAGTVGLSLIYRRIKPINSLMRIVGEVTEGNMNINPDPALMTKDEIGILATDVYKLVDLIKHMVGDLSAIDIEVNGSGNTKYRINESAYSGSYREMVGSVNTFIDRFVTDMLEFMEAMTKISNGDFGAAMRQMPGEKSVMNENIKAVSSGLRRINGEILKLTQGATAEDRTVRADAEKYGGDWKKLLQDLNVLVATVAEQANWYENILDAIPTPISVTDNEMNWTFMNRAAEAYTGKTRHELRGQPCCGLGTPICGTEGCAINCIRRGMNRTAFQQKGLDFQVEIAIIKDLGGDKTGYVEILQDITQLEDSVRQMDEVMHSTLLASEQVSQGARRISESSQGIAEGASSQAAALRELSAGVEAISTQTRLTAQDSRTADSLSKHAREKAVEGDREMKKMLDSMEGIKMAANNIAKIINTIETIAFQTNILALNASVEAARAGQHGKGFSVVADEVRLLAGHSKQAVQETSELITVTIEKVDEGREIALATDKSFREIIGSFEDVSKLIQNIAVVSSEQAETIGQFLTGVSKISEITQANSATSQEAAAASEELASQSERLIGMFKDNRSYS